MSERFLAPKEVFSRISLSRTHVYRLIRTGRFPRPVPLGPQRVAFLETEIEDWMAARIREREDV